MGFLCHSRNKALAFTPKVSVVFNNLRNLFPNDLQDKYIQDSRGKGIPLKMHIVLIQFLINSGPHTSYKKFSI